MASGPSLMPGSLHTDLDTESTVCPSLSSSGSPTSPARSHATKETSVGDSGQLLPPLSSLESGNGAPLNKCMSGWSFLAHKMTETPDYESFSRFRELNVKNLLYYQVEIAHWEKKLRETELNDQGCRKRPRVGHTTSAEKMLFCHDVKTDDDRKQRDIVYKIRELLEKYNAALLQHAQITALPHPNYHNVETLRLKLGTQLRNIEGSGSQIWGDLQKQADPVKPIMQDFVALLSSLFWDQEPERDERDLVTVHPPQKLDGFTRWVKNKWTPFSYYHLRCWRPRKQTDGEVAYSVGTMLKFTSAVATVVACVLPTVAIGILTTAKTTLQKLGYIAGFTALFAIGLMWLTDAGTSRANIFTATAAFSAVLVVFVQNQ